MKKKINPTVMNMRFIIIVAFLLTSFFSCMVEDRFLESPTLSTPDKVSLDLYFNRTQIRFVAFLHEASRIQTQLVRAEALTAPNYLEAFSPQSMNDVFRIGYRRTLFNAKQVTDAALNGDIKSYIHYAIAQVIKAYTLMELVDMFGDVPYSEAFSDNDNPKLDKSDALYAEVLKLLDDALANFSLSSASVPPANDLFYNGNVDNWTKLIHSLKLKCFIQSRLVNSSESTSGINELIAENKFISKKSEDFQFTYNTTLTPDSRNDIFIDYYTPSGPSAKSASHSVYIGTYGASLLHSDNKDPRWRFLIYRQSNSQGSSATASAYPCTVLNKPTHYSDADLFCRYSTFWTRDHGSNSGIPPDGRRRTIMGMYPAGGRFDDNSFKRVSNQSAGKGIGIFPIFTSSMVKLYRAEAAITLTTQDAGSEATLLEGAMDDFSTKLLSYNGDLTLDLDVDTTNAVYKASNGSGSGYNNNYKDYKTSVINSLSAASAEKDKLNIIAKELYKASWGNGIEPFNTYRRTGCPNDFQPIFEEANLTCLRNFLYAGDEVERNTNVTQKPAEQQLASGVIFWDTNPEALK